MALLRAQKLVANGRHRLAHVRMSRPNMTWLELDVTYVCGMGCQNCNRMTQLVPGRREENLRPEQIDELIADSERIDYPWREWFLVGGEPTTHPDLEAIIPRISKYRDRRGPGTFQLTIATHGHGAPARQRLRELTRAFPFLRVLDSHKSGPVHPEFVAPCVAPIDRAPQALAGHRFGGCSVSWHCGLGFNFAGFYCCAVAGAIDRIRGCKGAIARLEEVTEPAIRELYQVFCPLCGYYPGAGLAPITGAGQTLISETWHQMLAAASRASPKPRPPQ
jgi:hypothetical protein